jgi:predicted dehydrogenase/threonine dehydrogenase-like Zn-dependent dehydrogenase
MGDEMIQAIIKNGKVITEEVPAPIPSNGSIIIKVINSCISSGTESVDVKTTGDSLIKRAIEQPQNVRKVLDMAKSEGLSTTFNKLKNKLTDGKPTGYSVSGIVIGVGDGVSKFKIGDKVAAGGAGIANHAEYVDVPENLAVKIPFGLSYLNASTITLGAIALQSVRRTSMNLGEFAVVYGTGILGLLAIQFLKVSGVRIAAVDLDNERLKIAEKLGAEITINPNNENAIQKITEWSNGFGADAIIFAAATSRSEPLSQAFQMCKKKGKVVLLGVSGMNIKREDIYTKELDLLVSTSYGPGRYDHNYEQKGYDYPYAYVRWTENRNMQEYLRLLSKGIVSLELLVSKIFSLNQINEAFEIIQNSNKKPLMVIIEYGQHDDIINISDKHYNNTIILNSKISQNEVLNIALIGAGNFAVGAHIPNIIKMKEKYKLYAVMNKTGLKGKQVGQRYGANYVTTSYDQILSDENVDLVFITTRHDSHAELTLKALKAGKNVFVEKPLAINERQIDDIQKYFENTHNPPILMVGFNRRFSKCALEIKKHTEKAVNPLFIHYRMNAGYIPLDHWVHDDGGRIIGEGCHLIDLMNYFIGCRIKSISVEELTPRTEHYKNDDNKSFILKYEDGSVATIEYFAIGNNEISKEYMEIHFDQKTIVMDDYKSLKGYGIEINEIITKRSEKGHLEELNRLYQTITGLNPKWPIELWDILQTTKTSLLIAK